MYWTQALFVPFPNFESILEPLGRQVTRTTSSQQYKVSAVAVIFTLLSSLNFNQRTMMRVKENALADFLDTLIVG